MNAPKAAKQQFGPPLSEAEEAGFGDTPWQGIFLMRGQSFDLSSFTISEDDEGRLSSTGPSFQTSTHMAPYWLEAGIKHACDAERLSHLTNQAFRTDNSEAKVKALNAEMVASMQAISCAAFAVDALHAALLKVQPTPEATKRAWRKNRTKRSRQIFETIRRAIKLDKHLQVRIKLLLDRLTNARDKAVHPPSKSSGVEKHARLPVSIEPAFNMFRTRNAIVAVAQTIDLIESVSRVMSAQNEEASGRMSALHELVQPLAKRWRRTKAGRTFANIRAADPTTEKA